MNEVKYVVNVPPNVYAGDYFNVQLGPQNKVYTVRCPGIFTFLKSIIIE